MNKVTLNKPLPILAFESTDPSIQDFGSFKGKHIVVYFYPKDNTPGCTQEGIDFSKLIKSFEKLNTQIIGVSRDSLSSHEKFCEKHSLLFPLISDHQETLCKAFDVIKEKNMYGKKVMGIERSTFLIDKNGIVRQAWRKVKVENHAKEVLAAVKAL